MTGFPPAEEELVTLANWQEPPSVRWAFRHMREIIPSQVVPCGETPSPLPSGDPVDLSAVGTKRLDGDHASVESVMADTFTDALVLLHDGRLVAEHYFADFEAATPHLLMSVSKSVVGCVAGVLADQGKLDVGARVDGYVPEVADSGYGDATVRDLLDMRTGVLFRETYEDVDAEVRVIERSMGWRPRQDGDPVGMYPYLATLTRPHPHGGRFTYRSADTDMLGWVCERVAGQRMADLVSELLWVPLGTESDAEFTCDAVGSAVHDGGMSAVPRDMARFGQMLLDEGAGIVPSTWLEESHDPGADVRAAFAASDNEEVLPGGWYRNQFWFVPASVGTPLVCLGIHGQMVYVNPATRLVAVKLSSWPTPQSVPHLVDTLRAFDALGVALAGPH